MSSSIYLDDKSQIEEAQSWYEQQIPKGVQLGFTKVKSTKSKLNCKPDWKYVYKVDHPDFTAVQVPLSVQGSFVFVTPERKKAFEETGDKRYMKSFTQMVVVNDKNKKTGKTIGFLMTIIPDKAYLEATNFDAYSSSYLKWQKGYSGLIYYHTLEGKFLNGWRFANEKVIKTISQNEGSNIDLKLNAQGAQKAATSTQCDNVITMVSVQACIDWTTYTGTTTSIVTNCGNPLYQEVIDFSECYSTYSSNGNVDFRIQIPKFTLISPYQGDGVYVSKNEELERKFTSLMKSAKFILENCYCEIGGCEFKYSNRAEPYRIFDPQFSEKLPREGSYDAYLIHPYFMDLDSIAQRSYISRLCYNIYFDHGEIELGRTFRELPNEIIIPLPADLRRTMVNALKSHPKYWNASDIVINSEIDCNQRFTAVRDVRYLEFAIKAIQAEKTTCYDAECPSYYFGVRSLELWALQQELVLSKQYYHLLPPL